MATYKYLRVSTKQQGSRFGIQRQQHELNKLYPDAEEFVDMISGAKRNRPALMKLLSKVQPGDKIVCASLDRLGRNTQDTLKLIEDLREKGVSVHFVKENIDTSNNSSFTNFFITMLSAFAELERAQNLERQQMAKEAAQEKGQNIGRPRTKPAKVKEAIRMVNEGHTYREVAEALDISKSKVSLIMKEYRDNSAD